MNIEHTATKNLKPIVLFVITCTLVLSCYKDKEGCTDKFASNYDVAADIECENCCQYPSLALTFSHKMIDTDIALNKELKNDINSSVAIINQKFYLSNISIEDNKKVEFRTKGTYILTSGQQVEYVKDYILVSNLSTSATVNTFLSRDPLTKLNFTLGIDDKFNAIDVPKATSYFELDEISGMYDKNTKSYLSYTSTLAVGQGLKDTITVSIRSDITKNQTVSGVQSKYGESIAIPIKLRYDKLFSGVNFLNSKASIEDKIGLNFTSFIQ